MNEFKRAIFWLRNSPMQRMSLGSRELFHSDFLAWLFETYPESLAKVISEPVECIKVERERQHLDLVVSKCARPDEGREPEAPKPFLIIENKFKSYPDKKQLERYNDKLPEVKRRILLTLLAPDFDMPAPWETLLYEDLADRLKEWFSNADVEQDHTGYIRDYMTMITYLANVASVSFDAEKLKASHYWFGGPWGQELSEIGFAQTLTKFQAAAFLKNIEEDLKPSEKGKQLPPIWLQEGADSDRDYVWGWSALFNNTPCATFVLCPAHPVLKGLRFEFQIQGRQYRRLIAGLPLNEINAASRTKSEKCEKVWSWLESADAQGWLFGRGLLPKDAEFRKGFDVGGSRRPSSMRADMCFYSPDAVYQYLDISVEGLNGELTVEKLHEQISRDIELGFRLLNGS
jgi:hypothetical protein